MNSSIWHFWPREARRGPKNVKVVVVGVGVRKFSSSGKNVPLMKSYKILWNLKKYCEILRNIMIILFRIYSGFIQDLFRIYSGFIQDLFWIYSGFHQDLFKIYSEFMGFIQDLFRIYSGFVQDFFRIYTGFIQDLFRIYSGFIEVYWKMSCL